MSQFYEYNWPAASANGIALFQATTANKPLNLNGSSVNKTSGQINFIDFGIVPRITLNSLLTLRKISKIYLNAVE